MVAKKTFPDGENRAHRPTHKILSADKIKKRSLLIDTTNSKELPYLQNGRRFHLELSLWKSYSARVGVESAAE